MSEVAVLEDRVRGEAPAVEPGNSQPELQSPETADNVCRTSKDFVARVIYDGRFLDCFTHDPETVAKELGVTVLPEVVTEVRAAEPIALLAEVTEQMTREHGDRVLNRPGREHLVPSPVGGVGTEVAVGIVACTTVAATATIVIDQVRAVETVVVDESPDADLKL